MNGNGPTAAVRAVQPAARTRLGGWDAAAAIVLAALAAGPMIVFCYSIMFRRYEEFDDEGYMMVTIKHFLDGWPLYDEVLTGYGPAYFLLSRAAFTVLPLDH